jgi:hypothetical protein
MNATRRLRLRCWICVGLACWIAACTDPDAASTGREPGPPADRVADAPAPAVAPARSSARSVSPGALGPVQSVTPSDAWFFVADRVDGLPLHRLGRLALLGNGDVLAVHHGGSELLALSAEGSLRRRIGGRGEGPAEFADLRDAWPCSDSLVVANDGDRYLTSFRPEGELVEAASLAAFPEAPLRVVGADRGCSTFLLEKLSPPASPVAGKIAFGNRRLFRLDPAAERLEPVEITSRWIGSFSAGMPAGATPIEAPFALGDDVALGLDGSVIVISHDRGELVLHRPPGYAPSDTVRWSAADVPERSGSWEELFERPFAAARERFPELRGFPAPEAFPEPSALPKSDRILVGQDGTIFVRLGQGRDRVFFFAEPDRPALPRERWIAFSPEGELVGHYLLPRAHRLVGGGPGRELFVAGTDDAGLPLAYWVPAESPF